MKLDKRDRQGVRTPGDLEQKYALMKLIEDVEHLKTALNKLTTRVTEIQKSIADESDESI